MATLQYIGARYIPIVDGEWIATKDYEPLTIVTYNGTSYISKITVPRGTLPTDSTFWLNNGSRDAYIIALQNQTATLEQETNSLDERVTVLEQSGGGGEPTQGEKWLALIYHPTYTATGTFGNLKYKVASTFETWDKFSADSDWGGYSNIIVLGNYNDTNYTGLMPFLQSASSKNLFWGVSYMTDTDNWDNASTNIELQYRLTTGDLTAYRSTFLAESYTVFDAEPNWEKVGSYIIEWLQSFTVTKNVRTPLRMYTEFNIADTKSGVVDVSYLGLGVYAFHFDNLVFNSEVELSKGTSKVLNYGTKTPSFTPSQFYAYQDGTSSTTAGHALWVIPSKVGLSIMSRNYNCSVPYLSTAMGTGTKMCELF